MGTGDEKCVVFPGAFLPARDERVLGGTRAEER